MKQHLSLPLFLLLLLVFPTAVGFAQQSSRNQHNNPYGRNYTGPHPRYSYGPTGFSRGGNGRGGISPGAVAAVAVGVGVVGYIVGRSANRSNNNSSNNNNTTTIECRNFPMVVIINNTPKEVLVQKCRSGNGDWQLPD